MTEPTAAHDAVERAVGDIVERLQVHLKGNKTTIAVFDRAVDLLFADAQVLATVALTSPEAMAAFASDGVANLEPGEAFVSGVCAIGAEATVQLAAAKLEIQELRNALRGVSSMVHDWRRCCP